MGIFDIFKGKKPPPSQPIRRNRWDGYVYTFGEDQRCVVSFDVDACEPEQQDARYSGRRVILFAGEHEVTQTGLPTPEAFRRMHAVGDQLVAALEANRVDCWQVGGHTYNGLTELIFEVADVPAFMSTCASVLGDRPDVKLVPFEGWEFFNAKIRPGLLGINHISNRELIKQVKAAGSNLESVHALDHHFLGAAEDLARLEEELSKDGLRRTSAGEGSLTMTQELPLDDQDTVDSATLLIRRLAEVFNARYDGWGTLVKR
jgi:regulator of RNase E activity RraB